MKSYIQTLAKFFTTVCLKPLPQLFNALFLLSSMNCRHVLPQAPPVEPSQTECSNTPDFAPFDRAPQVIKAVQPVYPEAARQAGLQGTVWVRALVDKEGTVVKAEIQKSDAEIFNQPALDAIMQWRFTPALQRGVPVCVWIATALKFKS